MDPKIEFVSAQVIQYLKDHAGYDASLALDSPVRVLEKLWSVVYFMTLNERGHQHPIVVKVSRFPDQQSSEESWEEEHLIDRGIREYNSLVRIYDHFKAHGDERLQAVRPIAFVQPVNGIIMDFVHGEPYYKSCLSPQRILAPNGRRRAGELAQRTGEWLRAFHDLTPLMHDVEVEEERLFTPTLARQALLEAVEHLQARGIDPTRWPRWREIEAALSQLDSDERVWIHSDFHMMNATVLPGDHILCMDTALDKQDHPYRDVGKFLADLQSRRVHTLSYEMIPTRGVVEELRRRFLAGYLQGRPLNQKLLALYEGQYLFEKWDESLDALDTRLRGKVPSWARLGLEKYVLNPTFARIIQRRMRQDLLREPDVSGQSS